MRRTARSRSSSSLSRGKPSLRWRDAPFFTACLLAVSAAAAFMGLSLKLLLSPQAQASAPAVVYEVHVQEREALRTDVPAVPPTESVSVGEVWQEPRTDVLFVGNSLAVGLKAADASGTHAYLCKTGASLPGIMKLVPEGTEHELNVVIAGSNELGLWDEDSFKSAYLELCGKLGGPCLCMSVPPVCEAKSRYGARVSNGNAALYSGWIRDLCEENDTLSYLDCAGYFGESLDPALTGDGLHLTGQAYAGWLGWICEEGNIG